jgi:predicted nucleic acid-binding protein
VSGLVVVANVVLRLLTDEPRPLADRAAALLTAASERGIPLVIAPLTVAEVVYVLQRVYGWSRRDLADRLLELVAADVFTFLDRGAIRRALGWYGDRSGLDFPDAYLAGLVAEGQHDAVATFDDGLGRSTGAAVVRSAAELPTIAR